MKHHIPTKEELQAARSKTVQDVIAPGLRVLFVGINPGLYTAAIGHHFGKPGNRFWPALYLSGFTPRQLSPYEEALLLDYGLGITNVVTRTTASEKELTKEDFRKGGKILEEKIRKFAPQCVAVLGVGAYRTAFQRPKAGIGRQEETLGDTLVWVLPNPSGLNQHYSLEDLAALFRELRESI